MSPRLPKLCQATNSSISTILREYWLILVLNLLLIPAFYSSLSAQTSGFIHYGVENGLSQSQVETILQDKKGQLWIGTLSGLTRYNGREFHTFSKRDSLAEEYVTTSLIDSRGDLWFGHWAGGLTYYNSERETFRNLNFEEVSKFVKVTDLLEGPEGNIWVATRGSGIHKIDPEDGSGKRVEFLTKMVSSNVLSIWMDARKKIWIGTDDGLVIYNTNKDLGREDAYQTFGLKEGMPGLTVSAITGMSNGNVAVATERGVVVVNNAGERISPEGFIILDETKGLLSGDVVELMEDSRHNLWIGTANSGVTCYNMERGEAINYTVRNGLNFNVVNAIFEDRENNLWIGTKLGLNLFKGDVFLVYNESDGITNNIVWDILEDSRRNFWLATNNGVSRLSFPNFPFSSGSRSKPEVMSYSTEDGLSDNVVLTVFEDRDGDIWFGTASGSATLFRTKDSTFVVYDELTSNPNETVFSICQDREGAIWFGTRNGAVKLDKNLGTREIFDKETSLLKRNVIYRIFADSQDRLWLSALGGELAMYDGRNFRFYGPKENMNDKIILSITEDQGGHLWFGSYGGGVYEFDGETFTNYTADDGLSTNTAYSVFIDNENNLWVGTSRGIEKYDRANKTFHHYGKQEGFWGVETNADAVDIDNRGNLWFGTIMGAVRYNPSEERAAKIEPITQIYNPRLLFEEVEVNEDHEFSYFENHLTFDFLGVSLSNPAKVRYQYRLKNYDEEWSPVTKITTVTYPRLTPGTYTFQVKSSNENGAWNDEPAEYTFTILPPFWRTWWFYLLCLLGAIGIVFLMDRYRTRNLMDARKLLENQVKQRTLELDKKNSELAYRNKVMTDNIRYAQRIQSAILPDEKALTGIFSDHFVIYKPKELVSGDLYWMKIIDGATYFAVIDCTGHGMPGALLSILGQNALTRSVTEFGISDPAAILGKTDELLREALVKEGGEVLKDTMDIMLCKVDSEKKVLTYAAANNGVYVVRAANKRDIFTELNQEAFAHRVTHPENTYKLIELKGEKQSLGGAGLQPLTEKTFNLIEGDTLYLYTDGFADQFGGDRGKKMKYTRFKQLLLFNQDKPMKEQGEILESTFDEWKGDLEQIDDVCIIGIKL